MHVNLAIGGFFGGMQISVTAFALEHGSAGIAAVLFTVFSCASLLGRLRLYGLRQWRTVLRVQLAVAAGGLAIGCLPLLLAHSPLELGFGVALTGLAIPLILILCSLLAEASVHRAVLTQAFAWLNSASAAGSPADKGGGCWLGSGTPSARMAASRGGRDSRACLLPWQCWPWRACERCEYHSSAKAPDYDPEVGAGWRPCPAGPAHQPARPNP